MKTKSILRLFLAAACSLPCISSAQTTWNGSVDGNWNVAGNWNSALASPNAGNLTFSGTANQTNTNNAGVTSIGTLTLSNGGWDIDLGASAVTMNAITTTGSSTLTGNVFMGNGTPKTITLNGTNTTLEITGQLNISRANNTLNLVVDGAGNTLLVGSLNIGDGSGNKTISGTGNVTVTGAVTETLTGTAALVKGGDGVLTFNGAYTSNSPTTVNGGTLLINGNASTATGAFTVGASGTLGGIGTIGGATTVNGTLAAGQNGIGKLTFANTLTLTATTATTVMEIDGLAGAGVSGGNDFVDLTGAGALGVLTYGGALTLDISTLFAASASWNLFDFASETGTFDSITLADQYSGSLLDGNTDGIWELVDGTHSWTFTESTGVLGLTVIPEPGAVLLGGLGLLLLLRRRRD